MVHLVLLQQMFLELTGRGQEPLSMLLQFGSDLSGGVCSRVHHSARWLGHVFSLESEEEEYPRIIVEDSNDIFILPMTTLVNLGAPLPVSNSDIILAVCEPSCLTVC